jgi:hypothetical protein
MEYKSIKEIAKEVRIELKKQFPNCKFSVVKESYSMGQSLTVSLMSAPFEAVQSMIDVNGNKHEKYYFQLNQYQLKNDFDYNENICNGIKLTKEAFEVLKKATEIANKENWDKSDIQSDYFNVNFYFHLAIGKWDKPFVNTKRRVK